MTTVFYMGGSKTFKRNHRATRKTRTAKPAAVKVEPAATPEPAAVEPVKVEPVALAPVTLAKVEEKPVVRPFKPSETDGIPGKDDTFHIVTLTSNVYNGFSIPFPGNEYPVFMIANQDGKLMRVVDQLSEDKKRLMWSYRPSSHGDSESAMRLAIADLKRLKTWQRKNYGKQVESADSLTLPARGTLASFEIMAKSLLGLIKSYGEKTYLEIEGYLFPAKTLAAVCRLADSDMMQITLEKDHLHKWEGKTRGEGWYTKQAPAIVIRHGNSKTALLGQELDDYTRNSSKFEIVPCSI